MPSPMLDWLHNPRAAYVVAAYGVAAAALLALGLVSWRAARRARLLWAQRQDRRA